MTIQNRGGSNRHRFGVGKRLQRWRVVGRNFSKRRRQNLSKAMTYVYILLCGSEALRDSLEGSQILDFGFSEFRTSDIRISDPWSETSCRSYTAIRPGNRVVNADEQLLALPQDHRKTQRVLYQKKRRTNTDETTEYRSGHTILSVRNSAHPVSPSTLTSGTDDTEDLLNPGALERRIAAERVRTQEILEGISRASASVDDPQATDEATKTRHREQRDRFDLSKNTPVFASTSSQASSSSPDEYRAYQASRVEAPLQQQEYVPYVPYPHGPQRADRKGKAPLRNISPPRPRRPSHHGAAYPSEPVFGIGDLGLVLEHPSELRRVRRKPLPAHVLKVRSRETSRHPDSLFTDRNSSQLQRAQKAVSNPRNVTATDRGDIKLVPDPLQISRPPLTPSSTAQVSSSGEAGLDKPLPGTPTERLADLKLKSPLSRVPSTAPRLRTRIPSPRFYIDFDAQLGTAIPSPDLHVDFSSTMSSYSLMAESDCNDKSTITVALSPADFPPLVSSESDKFGGASTSTNTPSPSSSPPSSTSRPLSPNKPLPPTPGPPLACFSPSLLFSDVSSLPGPSATRTHAMPGLAPSSTTPTAVSGIGTYEAYQPPFVPVSTELRGNRRRGETSMPLRERRRERKREREGPPQRGGTELGRERGRWQREAAIVAKGKSGGWV